jgi:hypothetical protein
MGDSYCLNYLKNIHSYVTLKKYLSKLYFNSYDYLHLQNCYIQNICFLSQTASYPVSSRLYPLNGGQSEIVECSEFSAIMGRFKLSTWYSFLKA